MKNIDAIAAEIDKTCRTLPPTSQDGSDKYRQKFVLLELPGKIICSVMISFEKTTLDRHFLYMCQG